MEEKNYVQKKSMHACPYYYKLTFIDGKKIYVTEDVSTFCCYELTIFKKKEVSFC